MFCSNCGTQLEENSVSCNSCGTRNDVTQPVSPLAPQQSKFVIVLNYLLNIENLSNNLSKLSLLS